MNSKILPKISSDFKEILSDFKDILHKCRQYFGIIYSTSDYSIIFFYILRPVSNKCLKNLRIFIMTI